MKTDRELLELAAKAAGLNVKGEWVDGDDKFTHLNIGKKFTNERMKWNPLTDDGDALRLAVKLSLPIEFRGAGMGYTNTSDNHRVMCGKYWDGAESRYDMLGERYGGDKQAATRRAITRAAAQIQLNKETK